MICFQFWPKIGNEGDKISRKNWRDHIFNFGSQNRLRGWQNWKHDLARSCFILEISLKLCFISSIAHLEEGDVPSTGVSLLVGLATKAKREKSSSVQVPGDRVVHLVRWGIREALQGQNFDLIRTVFLQSRSATTQTSWSRSSRADSASLLKH